MTKTKYVISGMMIVIISLVMIAVTVSGCSFRKSTRPPEATPGSSDTTDLSALIGDQLTEAERESLTQRLLNNYVFYQGRVTLFEKQKWLSEGSDGSSGTGDSTLSADEILVYDPQTEKCYIVVRYMSSAGWHKITVNDLNGDLIGHSDVHHSGELYEYYGTGLLWRKSIDDVASSISNRYTLNFAANPVRIDNLHNIIYTYPSPRQPDWVTYVSITGTERRGGIRMFPPEENPKNTTLNQVPHLANISASNTYNSDESRFFHSTNRIWTPSGTFSYDYQRLTYSEAMAEILKLKQEAESAGAFGAMAASHPPAWQQTAALADSLGATVAAARGAEAMVNAVFPQDVIDVIQNRNAADTLANEKTFQKHMSEIRSGMAPMSASSSEQGVLRQLEGVIIESSAENGAGKEQKNLKSNFYIVKPHIEGLFTKYASLYESLQQTLAQIRIHLTLSRDFPVARVNALLQDCRQQLESARGLNTQVELLLGDLGIVLYDLNAAGTVDNEFKYSELNRLFAGWEQTFKDFDNIAVDIEKGVSLPDGYPDDIIPVMPGAIIAIANKLPGQDGSEDGFALTLKTHATINEAVRYYEIFLKNIPDVSSVTIKGITTLSGENYPFEFSIMVLNNNLGGAEKTIIQITLTPIE